MLLTLENESLTVHLFWSKVTLFSRGGEGRNPRLQWQLTGLQAHNLKSLQFYKVRNLVQ